MKKIALLVISLFVLVGCQQSASSDTITTAKPFIGGTDSIEFEFIEGSPPPEVYDGGNFDFETTLNVEHKGEFDVDSGKLFIVLKGFFPSDFGSPMSMALYFSLFGVCFFVVPIQQ